MSTFKKGDRVLCTNTNWQGNWPPIAPNPQLLEFYTVEHVYPDDSITLSEIDLTPINIYLLRHGSTPDAAFWSWHFIKVDDWEERSALSEKESETIVEHLVEII